MTDAWLTTRWINLCMMSVMLVVTSIAPLHLAEHQYAIEIEKQSLSKVIPGYQIPGYLSVQAENTLLADKSHQHSHLLASGQLCDLCFVATLLDKPIKLHLTLFDEYAFNHFVHIDNAQEAGLILVQTYHARAPPYLFS